jgi:hypothetical protein
MKGGADDATTLARHERKFGTARTGWVSIFRNANDL